MQTRDGASARAEDLRVVTKRAPKPEELEDLLFAWRVAKYVKSNAIVCVKERATLGVGAGQMSRVVSSKIAALKAADAGLSLKRRRCGVRRLLSVSRRSRRDRGARDQSMIQPGGSKRDADVIAAADEHGIAMVFTGTRHFRH